MQIDLRTEQVKLLRVEKQIVENSEKHKNGNRLTYAAVAAVAASVTGIAAQAAEKLGSDEPLKWAQSVEAATKNASASPAEMLAAVYETVTNGHAAIESMAVEFGARLLPMANGVPKKNIGLVWANLGLF